MFKQEQTPPNQTLGFKLQLIEGALNAVSDSRISRASKEAKAREALAALREVKETLRQKGITV